MSKLKAGLLVVAGVLVAAATGGIVGGGAALALVRSAYNGPVGSAELPEVLVNSIELGEPMTLRIHLPLEYEADPDRTFPVLWVLDGGSQGAQVARTVQVLALAGVTEHTIVVEVPSSSLGRRADFTPPWGEDAEPSRADRFLEFLRSEALPVVRGAYRVGGDQVLVGHSLGGLFSLYSLLQEPTLFDAYFVFSPSVWVGNEGILRDMERAVSTGQRAPTSLFLSLGSREGNEMLSGFEDVQLLLDAWSASELRWSAVITAGADHGTNPALSLPVALRWHSDG